MCNSERRDCSEGRLDRRHGPAYVSRESDRRDDAGEGDNKKSAASTSRLLVCEMHNVWSFLMLRTALRRVVSKRMKTNIG